MRKIAPLFLFCIALLQNSVFAQVDTLRICTYNILKFSESSGASRLQKMRIIMEHIDPDVLVVQEMITAGGVTMVLDSVFNYRQPNAFDSAPFVDGPDTDNALFYRSDRVELLNNRQIATDLRDISEFVLKANEVPFRIYSLHLKASMGSSNEVRRSAEATVLRNHLNDLEPPSNFVVLGDFNIYSASEPAFIKLTGNEIDNDGRTFDPIRQEGEWHNNAFFSMIHTQSVRTSSFGGGATGGLDDRFDMILISESIFSATDGVPGAGMRILTESYTAFGNDGKHFNLSIVTGSNDFVDATLADALHEVSDHLPVFADFVLDPDNIISAVQGDQIGPSTYVLKQNYPNPFNPTTTIAYSIAQGAEVQLQVFDLSGRLLSTLVDERQVAGEHEVLFQAHRFDSGMYFYRLFIEGVPQAAKKMIILK